MLYHFCTSNCTSEDAMPTIQARGGKYRAIVRLTTGSVSKTFDRKSEARAWGIAKEAELRATGSGKVPDMLFRDVLQRYLDEVTEFKEGNRWDKIRINQFLKDPMADVRLPALDHSVIAKWRDRRLQSVAPSTVHREATFLSGICTKAVKEWKLLQANPVRGLELPEGPAHRERLINKEEREKILFCLGYEENIELKMVKLRIAAAFLFALETGMRAGEILALEKRDIFFDKKYVKVRGEKVGGGKTRAARRDVPLSDEAVRILKQLPQRDKETDEVFAVASGSLDGMFRKATDAAMIENVTFHDSRHTACTKLARKLPILALARMIGHKDLNMLQVYYNETAEELAKLL